MPERFQIRGGAGPYEAAAIVTVIVEHEATERRRRSRTDRSNLLPAWVRAARPTVPTRFVPPVTPEPGLHAP